MIDALTVLLFLFAVVIVTLSIDCIKKGARVKYLDGVLDRTLDELKQLGSECNTIRDMVNFWHERYNVSFKDGLAMALEILALKNERSDLSMQLQELDHKYDDLINKRKVKK